MLAHAYVCMTHGIKVLLKKMYRNKNMEVFGGKLGTIEQRM